MKSKLTFLWLVTLLGWVTATWAQPSVVGRAPVFGIGGNTTSASTTITTNCTVTTNVASAVVSGAGSNVFNTTFTFWSEFAGVFILHDATTNYYLNIYTNGLYADLRNSTEQGLGEGANSYSNAVNVFGNGTNWLVGSGGTSPPPSVAVTFSYTTNCTYTTNFFTQTNDTTKMPILGGTFTGGVTNNTAQGFVGNASGVTNAVSLIAGSNMTITTNADGRTFTLASSGGSGITNGQNSVTLGSTTFTNRLTNIIGAVLNGTNRIGEPFTTGREPYLAKDGLHIHSSGQQNGSTNLDQFSIAATNNNAIVAYFGNINGAGVFGVTGDGSFNIQASTKGSLIKVGGGTAFEWGDEPGTAALVTRINKSYSMVANYTHGTFRGESLTIDSGLSTPVLYVQPSTSKSVTLDVTAHCHAIDGTTNYAAIIKRSFVFIKNADDSVSSATGTNLFFQPFSTDDHTITLGAFFADEASGNGVVNLDISNESGVSWTVEVTAEIGSSYNTVISSQEP